VIQKPREFVVAHPNFMIRRLRDWKIGRLFKKRAHGVPLAYVTGHKEFFGLDFVINKHVLIPRPETEMIVSLALEKLKIQDSRLKTILTDVGTGSGCIPISVTSTLKHFNTQALTVCATDISKSALKVAKQNAQKYNVNITFLHGNLLEPAIKRLKIKDSRLIITANLPYLTLEQFQNEHSIQHEPKRALVADNNGLGLYEQLLKQIRLLVTNYQLLVTCLFEIDPRQSPQISGLIKKYLPDSTFEIKKDLAGHDRVVCITIHSVS